MMCLLDLLSEMMSSNVRYFLFCSNACCYFSFSSFVGSTLTSFSAGVVVFASPVGYFLPASPGVVNLTLFDWDVEGFFFSSSG